jgi:frataxin
MDESAFQNLADPLLARLNATLEEALGDVADVDLRGGILTIELDDGRQYVVNKHAPTRQIWLSSPISGAAHFEHDAATATWRSTRGGAVLTDLLAAELSAATGRDVIFT